MVMTRGLKRKAQEEEEAAAIVIHHLYGQSQPPIPIASPASSSQGAFAHTPANISTELSPCTLTPQSEIVSSCLAAAEVDNPPIQVDTVVKPCSMVTSKGYPNQYFRQVSRKLNTSTAATGAIVRGVDDGEVPDGIHIEAPVSEIHHNGQLIMPNEHESLKETFMPIDEDMSKSMGEAYSNGGQTSSLNLSDMDSLDDDGSSFCSEPSRAVVTVGSYRVKEKLAPILKDIIAKYGDIAARCCKKSIMLRSCLVENVCNIVQKLQAVEFVNITAVEVDSFRIFIEDMTSDDVEVGWLLERLNEISEAKKLLKGYSKLKQAIRQNCQAIKEMEKQLKMRRAEERRLDEILSYTKAQVKRFHHGSMVDGLL